MSRPQDKLREVERNNSVRSGWVRERVSQLEEQCKKVTQKEGPKSKVNEERKCSSSSSESGYSAEDHHEINKWQPTDLTNPAVFSSDPFKALDPSPNGSSGQKTDQKRSADRFKINTAEKIDTQLIDVLNLKEKTAYAGQFLVVIGEGNNERKYCLYPEIQTGKLVCYTGADCEESLYQADENIANYIYRFVPGNTDPYENRQCSIFTTMLQGCRGLVVKQPPSPSTMNREGSDGDLHFENDGSSSVCFNMVKVDKQPAEVGFNYLENNYVELDMTYMNKKYCIGLKMNADCSKGEVTAYPQEESKPQTVQEAKFIFGEFVHI